MIPARCWYLSLSSHDGTIPAGQRHWPRLVRSVAPLNGQPNQPPEPLASVEKPATCECVSWRGRFVPRAARISRSRGFGGSGSGGLRPWLNGVQRAGAGRTLILKLPVAVPGHGVSGAQLAHDELSDGHGQDSMVGGPADGIGAGRLFITEDHFYAADFLRSCGMDGVDPAHPSLISDRYRTTHIAQ